MAAVARLKRRPEFLAVAASRRRWVAPGLILQAARRPEDSDLPLAPRIGFTASRKVGIAVVRNRARRRLKAAADQVLPLYGAPGIDYVAIARTETVRRPFAELVADLTTAIERLNAKAQRDPLSPGERVEG
jgi:ribonuclease P protein component